MTLGLRPVDPEDPYTTPPGRLCAWRATDWEAHFDQEDHVDEPPAPLGAGQRRELERCQAWATAWAVCAEVQARIGQSDQQGSVLLDYVERTLLRASVGFTEALGWCAAGHEAARVGRYRAAAARFDAAALVFATFPALGLADLARPCRDAADGLRGVVRSAREAA